MFPWRTSAATKFTRALSSPTVVGILYFIVSGLLSIHCYRHSRFDIDLLSYAGNVALFDSDDPRQVHREVYSHSLTAHLRGLDANDRQAMLLRKRSSDPYYSALYLPYFSVKPLYVLSMGAVHLVGANLVDASRFISAFFFFATAATLWLYTRSLLSLLVLVLPESMVLGQSNAPDAMSAFLLLFALWMVLIRNKDIGILPLLLAVWVRPENIILCMIVLAVLYRLRRLSAWQLAVLLVLAVGSVLLISRYGYGWRSLYAHTFLSSEPNSMVKFGMSDYVNALLQGLKDLLHSSVLTFVMLWAVCLRFAEDRMKEILVICGCYSAVRFIIYPSYEERYYAVFFLLTAAAGVMLISKTRAGLHFTGSTSAEPGNVFQSQR